MRNTSISSKWLTVWAGIAIMLLAEVFGARADTVRADINQDGRIDGGDVSILHGEMGRDNCASSPCQADLNADGKVNGDDLEILTNAVKSSNRAADETDAPAVQFAEPAVKGDEKSVFERKPLETPSGNADAAEEQQKDMQPAAGRFIDHKDGTVTDAETGLMWTKNARLTGDTLLFHRARAYIEEMNRGKQHNFGYTDWRLPTLDELRGLVDYTKLVKWEHTLPEGHPFENVQSLAFGRLAYLHDLEHAWFVSLYCRLVGHNVDACFGYVWAVRGGRGSKMER